MRINMDKEITIGPHVVFLEQAYTFVRQPILDSNILVGHPDDTPTEQADRLLLSLLDTDLLTAKTKAVIVYNQALKTLLLYADETTKEYYCDN